MEFIFHAYIGSKMKKTFIVSIWFIWTYFFSSLPEHVFYCLVKLVKNKSNKQIIKTNWTVMIGWGWNSVCHLNSKFPVWFDGPDIHKQHRCNHFCPICKCCFMYSGIFFSLSPKRKKNQRSKSKLLYIKYYIRPFLSIWNNKLMIDFISSAN